jgi:hypothetical protein
MTAGTKVRAARRRRLSGLLHSDSVAIAVSAVVALWFGFAFLRAPATVDTITITNPTDYDIGIEVRGSDGGWMPMRTAHRDSTTTTRSIIDQGHTWTFRFSAQGHRAGEMDITRDALKAAGWVIEIPASTEETLREAGTSPPP